MTELIKLRKRYYWEYWSDKKIEVSWFVGLALVCLFLPTK